MHIYRSAAGFAFRDLNGNPNDVTAPLTVPAGTYQVVASVSVLAQPAELLSVACTLQDSVQCNMQDYSGYIPALGPAPNTASTYQQFAFSGVTTSTSGPATITLQCAATGPNTSNQTVASRFGTITATRNQTARQCPAETTREKGLTSNAARPTLGSCQVLSLAMHFPQAPSAAAGPV